MPSWGASTWGTTEGISHVSEYMIHLLYSLHGKQMKDTLLHVALVDVL